MRKALFHKKTLNGARQNNNQGEEALKTLGSGERRNSYLSWEQEKQLIDSFKQKAAKGQIATTKEMQLAYEKLVGHLMTLTL